MVAGQRLCVLDFAPEQFRPIHPPRIFSLPLANGETAAERLDREASARPFGEGPGAKLAMLSVLHTYLRGGRQSPEMNACRFQELSSFRMNTYGKTGRGWGAQSQLLL